MRRARYIKTWRKVNKTDGIWLSNRLCVIIFPESRWESLDDSHKPSGNFIFLFPKRQGELKTSVGTDIYNS